MPGTDMLDTPIGNSNPIIEKEKSTEEELSKVETSSTTRPKKLDDNDLDTSGNNSNSNTIKGGDSIEL